MSNQDWIAPSLGDFEAMAQHAHDNLPAEFKARLGPLVVRISDFASTEILKDLRIDDPFGLTGLYDGVALTERSSDDLPNVPATIWLFRRAILDEWAQRGDVALGQLVTHVLIHEIAHHFGYSDDDIARIDDWRV